MRNTTAFLIALLISGQCLAETPQRHVEVPQNLRDEALIAWCIVPFDSKNRTPAERAEMVQRLGLRRVAYDWRTQHVPTFEEEILEYKKRGIEYFAFWGVHEDAFALFKKHDLHPQIWQTLGSPSEGDQRQKIKTAAEQILPLVHRTREMGCKLGLYNHGGWGGEPENMVAVCEYLHQHHDAGHVGIVYNLHHGHGHIDDFAQALRQMRPHLLCLNLNGMTRDGDRRGQKILPLGEGEFDVKLLSVLRDSAYEGPVGIIGHTQDDVELRLRDNLDGLHWILPQLQGKPPGPKPTPRTYSPKKPTPPTAANSSKMDGVLLDGRDEIRRPPITVECLVSLTDARSYNILVASETKRAGDHWEIFTTPGDGALTVYLPGSKPDHVRSQARICDSKPHTVTLIYETGRVRLMVDGKQVADQRVRFVGREEDREEDRADGTLGIGRLVEGGLGCRGEIHWVRISRGVRDAATTVTSNVDADDSTLLLWRPDSRDADATGESPLQTPEFSEAFVSELVVRSQREGDRHQGLLAFADAKSACLSCHRIGKHGGTVGPDLTRIGKQRKPGELVASILWPSRDVEPEYVAHLIVDDEGKTHQGYLVSRDEHRLVLRDPADEQPRDVVVPLDRIEFRREVGTLMPDNLAGTMTRSDLVDLVHFLGTLGTEKSLSPAAIESVLSHARAHVHAPAEFDVARQPLRPDLWPSWNHHVNRDRVFDFYSKQAEHFRTQKTLPPLLAEYAGLDGGTLGHWGNQDDTVWADDRWNDTRLGSVMCGVFRGKRTIPRAVCVRLDEEGQWSTCFDPDTLRYDTVWRGGFVKFSDHRHGFLAGIRIDGEVVDEADESEPGVPFQYHGFYRVGNRVVFSYRAGGLEILDSPGLKNEQFVRQVTSADEHPLKNQIDHPPMRHPQEIKTDITFGKGGPYVTDSIGLPFDNPWNALLFCGGHGFLPDGSALVCTMQGDVWHVTDFAYPSPTATWRRFASGLHHPLGMVIDEDGIFVLCRDQITRLHDRNGDGEADFYECFSRAFETSPAGHDFICGLERDARGFFYIASGNQGLVRISPDGSTANVIATGFRNPDGLGLTPDGIVTVPCSEGTWTPASMICAVRTHTTSPNANRATDTIPHYGHGGPREKQPPALPMVYLPRGLDNSSGGQVFVSSDRWGPLAGKMMHFSFGAGAQFLLLRDEVDGQLQGAVVPFGGEFRSGVHRGRFHPIDGQLYVTGMQGWGSYTPDDGCFSRVRYTGADVQIPTAFHAHRNGIAIEFSAALDESVAGDPRSHFAQSWNYRYSSAYGSPEFSTKHFGIRGHDTLSIKSAHVLADGRTLFVELPELQPVNQLHLHLQSSPGVFHELFATVHKLDEPRSDFPGYVETAKVIAPHPIVADLAMATESLPNPHRKKIKEARAISIETGTNLSYKTRSFRVEAGEAIALTLSNPDVVPHNWALVKPGTLDRVGRLADRLISDPDASLRHYVPATSDVLAYTNVVLPRDQFTIYFRAPRMPGRYPFLCTFPGHWKVMNGVMIVE